MSKPLRIALEGNIGVGKSTLLENLPKHLRGGTWEALPEPVDNPEFERLLQAFYVDQNKRIDLHMWIVKERMRETIALSKDINYISERSFIGDMVFAYANLLKHERPDGRYMGLIYESLEYGFHFPLDAVIYLDATPDACMKRIRSRGRDAENNIAENYIQYLHNCYQTHLPEIARHFKIPVIRIDWNEFHSIEYVAQCVHTTLGIQTRDDDENMSAENARLSVVS